MTATKRGQQNIKTYKGLRKEYKREKKWLNQLLGGSADRSGISGLLMAQRDNCVRILDRLAVALVVLEETLRDFSSERNSGKGRPPNADAIAICAAMDEALKEDASLQGKELRDRVWEILDEQGLGSIPNARIQRVIRERKVPSVE